LPLFSALIHLSAWIFAVCFAGQHVLVVLQEGGFVEISQSKQVLLNPRFLLQYFLSRLFSLFFSE
jgi:hypothetical protein